MGLTPELGLSMFGGSQGGDVSDDGYKFSIRDRQMVEALLLRLRDHSHTGASALVNPATPPALALGTDAAASIPAGTQLFYRVSYVDDFGCETAASEEYTITTPDAVDPPDVPAASVVAGGSLRDGGTYYLVTFYQNTGGETEPSSSTYVTVVAASGDQTVDLVLPAIAAGADGWRIYKRGPNSGSFYFLADQPVGSGASFVDDGSVNVDSTLPVGSANDTNSTNKVTVTAPLVAGVVPTGVARWRIYRSFESGVYADKSLVHEVVERVDETDPTSALVTTWDDMGDTLFDGIPLDISHTLSDGLTLGGGAGAGVSSVNGESGDVLLADSYPAVLPVSTGTGVFGSAILLVDATSGAVAITLHPSSLISVKVKKVDASVHAVTVASSSGTIDGGASRSITAQWAVETYVCDGTNWFVV